MNGNQQGRDLKRTSTGAFVGQCETRPGEISKNVESAKGSPQSREEGSAGGWKTLVKSCAGKKKKKLFLKK